MKVRRPKEQATLSRTRCIHDKPDEVNDPVRDALEELVRMGLVVDSGRRRWSDRTGRYEIVWVLAEHARKPH